jgi:hypothetical protein
MFAAYLWKEWREQRRTLILMTALLPLVHVVGWILLEPAGWWVKRNSFGVVLTSAITLLIMVCILAFDLVSREKQRSGLAFLCRLPEGTSLSFWAKVLLYSLVILFFGLAGPLTLLWVDLDPEAIPVPASNLLGLLGILTMLALALGFWGMAASCWLPRGSMALPLTFIIVGAGYLPYIMMWMPGWTVHYLSYGLGERLRPYPFDLEWIFMLFLFLPMASILVAWISYRAFAHGGTSFKAAFFGVPVFLLCIFSLWGWKTVRMDDWCAMRPEEGEFMVTNALIGKDGNYAFLNTQYRNSGTLLVYNLRTGAWRKITESQRYFTILDKYGTHGYHMIYPNYRFDGCPSYIVQPEGPQPAVFWNGKTGERIDNLDTIDLPGFNPKVLPHEIAHPFIGDDAKEKERWEGLLGNREELKVTKRAFLIHEGLWLVEVGKSENTTDTKSYGKWMLYHEERRIFTSAPCSDHRYWVKKKSILRRDFSIKTCVLSLSHYDHTTFHDEAIEKMIPEQDHWIVVRREGKTKQLWIWDTESSRYENTPLLSGFGHLRVLDSEWLATYGEQEFSYLIHRQSLETFRFPATRITSISFTPKGNPVLLSLDPPDHAHYRMILLDRITAEYTELSRPRRHGEFFRIVGIPDETVAYALGDGIGPFDHHLMRIDFSNRSIDVLFPKEE